MPLDNEDGSRSPYGALSINGESALFALQLHLHCCIISLQCYKVDPRNPLNWGRNEVTPYIIILASLDLECSK